MEEQKDLLSERELEILRLVATGAANKEIARQLVISPNTVKVHMRNIFTKVGVASRTEATLYAISIGLVKPGSVLELVEEAAQDSPAVEDSAALPEPNPAIVVEDRLPQRRHLPVAWQAGIGLLVVLLLLAVAQLGFQLFSSRSGPSPTVSSQARAATSVTQRWTKKAALPAARKGMGFIEYNDAFYLVGGETSQGIDGTLLLYQPGKNTWRQLKTKPTPVTDVQAALLGEKIYVPGGLRADGSPTSVLEVYDPRQDTWESKAPMPTALSAYALAAFEGQIYLFGGKSASAYVGSVYSYDPKEDRWQARSALDIPRAYAGTAVLNGKILVFGGFDGQHALRLNQGYFPNRDASGEAAWEELAPLPNERYAMGVTQLAGFIFLIGGREEGEQYAQTTLQYISPSDQWTALDNPPLPAGAHAALLASGNSLYLFGGESVSGLLATNQAFQAIFTISVPIINN